jgi:7-carboxy-7-deazaguanine synthase
MAYMVKEIFHTLQGEGAQSGKAAVFLRFAGCNLWSGREEDRATAVCRFCDTDFVGTNGLNGGKYTSAKSLAAKVQSLWQGNAAHALVVITGGEPLLQLDAPLIDALHDIGFKIAVESNGTLPAPAGIDWLCISPKAGSVVVQQCGDELKLVWPQVGLDWRRLESWDFTHFYLQPKDDAQAESNKVAAIAFVMENPRWRLSLQVHKWLGIP